MWRSGSGTMNSARIGSGVGRSRRRRVGGVRGGLGEWVGCRGDLKGRGSAISLNSFSAAGRRVGGRTRLAAWVERMELDDAGYAVTGEPRLVTHPDQLETFFTQVLSRQRALPVIALTNKARSQHFGVDPRGLAEAVRGVAHVACIAAELSPLVAQTLGRNFTVAHGAARIYAAGFHLDAGAPDHPLLRPLAGSSAAPAEDPGAFRRALCRKVCALGVRGGAA